MVFKRKIYEKLLEWKRSEASDCALLIEGARRIGKSTIVEKFAKEEYDTYLLIDFSIASDETKNYFNMYLNDLDTLFMLLSNVYNVKLIRNKSLIIFDEVQKCPKAREAIKHLIKDGRYHYIETGSLISVKENVKDILIPSEEKSVKMYPLDFEEFCWAFGKDMIIEYIKKCFMKKESLETQLHKEAMLLFKQYMLVGGMPQSIVKFIENERSFESSDKVKRNIINLYREDIMKLNVRNKSKVISIFDQIPSFLSRHEKRVILKELSPGSNFEKYEESFFWLADSMICNECFNCNDPNVGLSLNENRTYIKCYMGDTGLLISHTFDENELEKEELYKQILLDKLYINEGMFYENVIAQMLVSNGHKLYFYNHYNDVEKRNDIEIDFLISNNSKTKFKVFPIEVKSNINFATKSLNEFKKRFQKRIGDRYIIYPGNLKLKDDIIYIPPYMVICL